MANLLPKQEREKLIGSAIKEEDKKEPEGKLIHNNYPLTPEGYSSFALIIDGEAISHCLNTDELKKEFLTLIPYFR